LARAAALDQQGLARGLRRGHRLGRLGQLLEPVAEVLAVVHDRLHLAVEDAQDRSVLGPERPPARRARPLGPEPLDLVPLLLDLVILLQEVRAARGRVLLLPHPRRPLLLRGALGNLEPPGERVRLALHPGERVASRASTSCARVRTACAAAAARRACSSRAAAVARSRSSAAGSGSPTSRPCSSAASAFRCSRIRSWAILSCSYRNTRDRKAARSGRVSFAITARSFCPVKYVLKNSSCVIPSPSTSSVSACWRKFSSRSRCRRISPAPPLPVPPARGIRRPAARIRRGPDRRRAAAGPGTHAAYRGGCAGGPGRRRRSRGAPPAAADRGGS